ncbi:MAG: 6-hydroxymethylpterin diphosphokinase MptE-like protein, partial [Lentisphaerota bacterium]
MGSQKPSLPPGCRTAIGLARSISNPGLLFTQHPDLCRLYLVHTGTPAPAAGRTDSRIRQVAIHDEFSVPAALGKLFQGDALYFAEGKVGILFSPADLTDHAALCLTLARFFKEYTQSVLSSVALHATRGWHMLANALMNLPRLAGGHSIEELRGRFNGRAVVIVGAGPSLDATVETLKCAAGAIPIIACDAACSTLAHAGLVPDLIATTDDSERVWRHFAALPDRFRSVPLVCMLNSSWPVIRHHRGALYFGRSAAPCGGVIERKTGLPMALFDCGQCVGHAALEAACLLGGNPVIMTGFDLSFRADRFHPEHMQMPYFHLHPPPKENRVMVPGNSGTEVATDLSMFFYLKEFERRIKACGRQVINATEGGALIQGATLLSLKEALSSVSVSASFPSLSPGSH